MNDKEIQLTSDFIQSAERDELEIMLYTILSKWPYEKVKAFGRAALLRKQIDILEAEKRNTLYSGVENPKMKLVKEPEGISLNDSLKRLHEDLEKQIALYKKEQVTL